MTDKIFRFVPVVEVFIGLFVGEREGGCDLEGPEGGVSAKMAKIAPFFLVTGIVA